MIDPGRLGAALGQRARVDHDLVRQLDAVVRVLAGGWDSMPAPLLHRAVLQHLGDVAALLAGPLPPGIRRRVMMIAAQSAALAGWSSQFVGRDDVARRHLALAGQLAAGAGEPGIEALALLWTADLRSGVQRPGGDQADVGALLDRAEDLADPSAPSAVRAYVFLRQAEERAASGDVDEAQRYLDRADSALVVGVDDGTRYGMAWSPDYHAAFRGNVELLSGRPREALAILEDTLERQQPGAASVPAAVMADLAAAHARLGNLDAAAGLLGSAWSIADRAGLEDRMQRVRSVRQRDLARWSGEPAVRRLDEAIAAR